MGSGSRKHKSTPKSSHKHCLLTESPVTRSCTITRRSFHWSHARHTAPLCTGTWTHISMFALESILIITYELNLCTLLKCLFPPTFDCFPPTNHSALNSQGIFPFLVAVLDLFTHLHSIYTSSLNFCIISIIFLTKDRLF